MSKPGPSDLWHQAGGDRERYIALMLEHGYLRKRDPSEPPRGLDDPLLPCGITLRRLRALGGDVEVASATGAQNPPTPSGGGTPK